MGRTPVSLAIGVVLAVILAACGGGGGSTISSTGSVSALTVAEKVSVVDAQSSGGSGAPLLAPSRIAAVPTDNSSAYVTDPVITYVQERSVDAFGTVNQILCMMAQTQYGYMLNQGAYKAQVDINKCKGQDDASTGGQESANQSSSSTMPNYEMWTVEASRADNTAPQIIKAWIHESATENEPAKIIYAKGVVTEGVSSTNPYGVFTMNFKAFPVLGGVEQPQSMFRGVLKAEKDEGTGKVVLKFFDTGGFSKPGGDNVSFTERVALDRNSGADGGGNIYTRDISPMGTLTTNFAIAFNDDNFKRKNLLDNSSVCLDRKDFNISAWRYGVYYDNGARVNRNSGFPVRYDTHNGYIGYWGPWFQDNVTLVTGDTVHKQTFGPGGGTETPYTVLVSGGKLKKHTRKDLLLGEIVNIPLDYNEFGNDNQYRVLWNGTAFKKVAILNKSNYTFADLNPQQDFDLGALRFTELNFWSQALGGSVQVRLQGCVQDNNGTFEPNDDTFSCTASGTTPVITYVETTVNPGDTVPASFACFENCPDAATLGTSNPFKNISGFQPFPPSSDNVEIATYTFSADNMVLLDGGNPVTSSSLDSSFQWGLMSGPLFDPAYIDNLVCDFDSNATCGWRARSNLSEYYSWETGPNSWNRFTALQSGGTFVSFDPPLLLEYTHLGAGKYLNTRFYLEYSGFGDLHGIPGTCVSMDNGAVVDCSLSGPGVPIRWVPEFTVPDGSELTAGGVTYYVKALEKEQRMKKVGDEVCVGLDVAPYAALTLPDIDEWTDPTTGSGAIGSEPSVTGAPAVVGGVLQ